MSVPHRAQAERALFAEALKDPLNVKFMLVAHDAIPLYPPHVIWAQVGMHRVEDRVRN